MFTNFKRYDSVGDGSASRPTRGRGLHFRWSGGLWLVFIEFPTPIGIYRLYIVFLYSNSLRKLSQIMLRILQDMCWIIFPTKQWENSQIHFSAYAFFNKYASRGWSQASSSRCHVTCDVSSWEAHTYTLCNTEFIYIISGQYPVVRIKVSHVTSSFLLW